MTHLNFSPKSSKSSIFLGFLTCLILLLSTASKNIQISAQCYTATYSIVSDYSNEDLPLVVKKKLSNAAKQNRRIYTITQSSAQSYEQVDSIANLCGGASMKIKPEVMVRTKGQESIDYFYYTETKQKCFSVQEPEYLEGWKILGPISYKNSEERYFKAIKEGSDDYVIFDSNTPVFYNLKLIRGIPGLIVEASIGLQRISLLDFKTSSCSDLKDKINQIQEVAPVKVERVDDIDLSDILHLFSDKGYISSDDFECVESF